MADVTVAEVRTGASSRLAISTLPALVARLGL